MIKSTFQIIFITFLILATNNLFGQGCSDAGFCTMNSFKPHGSDSTKEINSQIKIGAFFGTADYSIAVFGNYLEYNRLLNNKFGIDVKLTTLGQNGNGISGFGLSDIFLNTTYLADDKLKLTLGTKIPLSNANKMKNNLALPLDYQASLGTFDFIFGIGYELNKLQLVAAIQQPLTQNNNQFMATNYPANSKLREFQSTNKYKRSGDVLLRVSYPIALSDKFKLTASLLPIYHLTNDKYTDELNMEREINNSKGLTLNGNIYFDYAINKKNALQLNIGTPFVARDVRPDGLTRGVVANLEYSIKF